MESSIVLFIFFSTFSLCITFTILICVRQESDRGEAVEVNLPHSPREEKKKNVRHRSSKRASTNFAKINITPPHKKTAAMLEEEYRRASNAAAHARELELKQKKTTPKPKPRSENNSERTRYVTPPHARHHDRVLVRESSEDEMIATYSNLNLRTLSTSSRYSDMEIYDDPSGAFV